MSFFDLIINIIIYLFLGLVALLCGLFIVFPKQMSLILDGMNGAMIADSIKYISNTLAKVLVKIPVIGKYGAPMVSGVLSGVLLGLTGVWVLVRTGKIDELVKLGDSVMSDKKGLGYKVMLFLRGFPPVWILGIIGIIAIDIVKFKFLDIPGDALKVFTMALQAWQELLGLKR